MSQIIKIENVNLWYDKGSKSVEVHALKNVSLEIEKGDYVAFFGPSGCGKTTMLYAISGIDRFQDGKILINDRDISGLTNQELAIFRQTGIGIVFQQFNLVPSLNVLKNVALPMLFVGVSSEKAEIEARKLIERLDLTKYIDRYPYELSGGQQQRVGIARALANNPPIIIADEPLGNLDSKNAQMVLEFLKELNEKDGRTVIMVTHEAWSLRDAKTIFHMKDGVITDVEKVKKVEKPKNTGGISVAEIAPIITLLGDNPMSVTIGNEFIDPGATAIDAVDGDCPILVAGNVKTDVLGEYEITYTSNNKSGNVSVATRIVKVVLAPSYDIIAIPGMHGKITPSGVTSVKTKTDQTYNIIPDDGYTIATLVVDGVSLAIASTYTFTNVTTSHTISVSFKLIPDIVPPVITLIGDNPMSVTIGNEFIDPGATAIDAVDGKCEVVITENLNTNVLGDYTINYTATDKSGNVSVATRIVKVVLAPSYDIIAIPGMHGKITPSGVTSVKTKTDQTYNIIPDDGYTIATLVVDGVSLAIASTYTFTNVTTSHTISVSFKLIPDIVPPVITLIGDNPMSVIVGTPFVDPGIVTKDAVDKDYKVLITKSVNTNVPGEYTITYTSTDKSGNVSVATRIVKVVLAPSYDIIAIPGMHGKITPSGVTSVKTKTDQTYNIIPDDGYTIATLVVDGVSLAIASTYTFTNVTTSHTISVSFAKVYKKEEKISTRTLANFLLSGCSMEEIMRFESFVNDKFDEKINEKEFYDLLSTPFKEGGIGLRRKKAEKVVDYLENIIEKRKEIQNIYDILNRNIEASILDEVCGIRSWLMEDYVGELSQTKLEALDQVISDRIRNYISAEKFVEVLDLSNNKFGVGFSLRNSQLISEKLELILKNNMN